MRTATLAVLGLLSFPAAALAAPPSDTGGRDRLMPQAPPGAEPLGRKAAEDWQARLRLVDADLRRGDWPAARKKSEPLVHEMFERIIDGESAAPLLAMAVLLRGLAVAGAGDRDAGLWDWFIAQSLFPDFRRTNLAPYGEPGKLFGEYRLAADGQRPATAKAAPPEGAAERPDPPVQAPVVRKRPEPTYPPALRRLCRKGKVVVESVIEKSGEPAYPVVVEPGESPVLTFSALEALRDWRFEPATWKGEPVRVFYVLTVNYETGGCRPRH